MLRAYRRARGEPPTQKRLPGGLAGVAGALGPILPAVTGIAMWLAPIAAIGPVVVMVGAGR